MAVNTFTPDDGVDVTHLLRRIAGAEVIDLADQPKRDAFRAYQNAFRSNEEGPSLHTAAALVRAWNCFADLMGLDRV